MGFIRPHDRWYLADVILEFRIEGDTRNVVHVNLHLIDADSAGEAYKKAVAIGQAAEDEYENTDGKLVCILFRGLRSLNPVAEALEDGAEIAFSESIDVPEETIDEWITPMLDLGAFQLPHRDPDCPNYMPESVMRKLEAEGLEREDLEREP